MKLNRILSIALSFVMLISVFTVTATAAESGGYEFKLIDGYAEITAYKGNDTVVEIPETLMGYTVVSIGDEAFRRSGVKSVFIPDSVKEIKADAFADSTELTTVKFSSNLESIGDTAFYNCENLSSAIRFPESLKKIGDCAFENCWDMTYAIIPATVEEIGYSALGYYYDSDTTDKKYYDYKRSDFRILGAKDSAAEAYAEKYSVDFYDVSTGVNAFTSNGLDFFVNTDGEAEVTSYAGASLTPSIPSKVSGYPVTKIDDTAFYAAAIKSVSIPESVTEIGEWAFENCDNLKSVKIPPTVKVIGEGALGYYFDGILNKQYDVFTICSQKNSAAYVYADSLGFDFEDVYTTVVTLKKSSGKVYLKGTLNINAVVKNPSGKTSYTSGNKKIAKVNSAGKITAVNAGKTKITVANNGVKKTFSVTVKKPKLNKTSVTIKRNKVYNLKITGQVGTAKFISGNKKILKVNAKNGNYKGLAPGKTEITVKTNGIKLKCKVKVK